MLSHGFTLFWFVMGAVFIGLGLIHRMASMTTPRNSGRRSSGIGRGAP
jgi:hypothetical protein